MNSRRLQKITIFLFHLLFLTTPFFFTWVNEELFEFPKMLLVYGFTILIGVTWIGRMLIEKKIILKQTVFDWPLLFFVISQTLSTIFSIHPATSIMGYYTRFHGGLLSTLAYSFLFYALVSNFSKKQLRQLWLTIFIAALGVTLYAIPEHFGHSPSCLIITKTFDVSCWVQDVKTRVFATFGQPNWLAAYAIMLIPLGITLLSEAKNKWQQALYGLTTITLLLTLLFTQSRSGLIGFGVSMITLISSLLWIQSKNKKQKIIQKSLLLIGIIGLVIAATKINFKTTPAMPTPTPINRLEAGGTDSGEIRKIVWQGAIDVWKRYPLLGSGVETFAYSYYQDRPLAHNSVSEWDFLYNKAHNELLNFLATTGAIGLISYLSILVWFGLISLKNIFLKSKQVSQADKLMLSALLSGVVALSISNFFGFSTVVVTVLLYTSLGSTAILVSSQHEKTKSTQTNLTVAQIGQLLLLGIIALSLLTKVINIWRADKAYATGKAYVNANLIQEGLTQLQTAIKLRPKEALYHSQLATTYSQIAVALEQQPADSSQISQFKQGAIDETKLALQLNPRHLNFYKAQAKVLITLATLDPSLLSAAKETLLKAIDLAPTDAKLMYNLALIEISSGQVETGIKVLEKTVAMKPNYEAARVALGKQYETAQKTTLAREQYQYIQDHITADNQEINQKLEKLTNQP